MPLPKMVMTVCVMGVHGIRLLAVTPPRAEPAKHTWGAPSGFSDV